MVTMSDNVEATEGSTKSTISEEQRSNDVKKVEELFAEGYKFFIGESYEAAAEKLGEAAELSVEVFGQFASQCFQPHYYYGRALVEVAREESLVVKAPQDEVEDEESEHEDSENGQNGADGNDHENTEAEKDITAAEEKQKDETLNAEETDDGEEISTGSLAWESLEVARKICEKQGGTQDWLEKQSDVLVALGDCMLFHLGRTCKSNYEFDKAAEFYENAAEALQKALDFATEKHKAENADPESASEIIELRKIVDEVREQVQDARDSQEMFTACKEQLKNVKPSNLNVIHEGILETGKIQDTSDVQDISTLVRKKRPATQPMQIVETNDVDNVRDDKVSSNGGNQLEQDIKKAKIDDNNENQSV
ncbi:protein NASP like protein [Ditylenchus destructor]|uniref:Protein NASP like protein n=1 Tax=Ditylenchus destructor TaxID=166010 RepID=A0AAD4NEP2_9BILA|nr:protein NASP like protein [Ditylenchus destructor]